jgi:hypothetical protein
MNYKQIHKRIVKLGFDAEDVVCKDNEVEIFVYRPSKLSKRFKHYDVKKNFQIWLRDGDRTFRPNHLRVMIDLNLRIRSRGDLKRPLLSAFDRIFFGECPDDAIRRIRNEEFEHYLNSLRIIAHLHQLFIVEQEYAYIRKSKYDPPTLFYQGWIRQMIDSPREIDNLCMSVCRKQPPAVKYTSKDDKNHENFQKKRKPFWYLEE